MSPNSTLDVRMDFSLPEWGLDYIWRRPPESFITDAVSCRPTESVNTDPVSRRPTLLQTLYGLGLRVCYYRLCVP